jgi:hypothetical protein
VDPTQPNADPASFLGAELTHPNPLFLNSETGFDQRRNADSGAIIVGAGSSALLHTDGRLPRQRVYYSNYGIRVDVQAWGEDIWTTGINLPTYCDGYPTIAVLEPPKSDTRCYTSSFSGKSGASSIIAGIVASVQGTLKAKGLRVLTPREMRSLLKDPQVTQPQTSAGATSTEHIGPLSDLRRMIPRAEVYARFTPGQGPPPSVL